MKFDKMHKAFILIVGVISFAVLMASAIYTQFLIIDKCYYKNDIDLRYFMWSIFVISYIFCSISMFMEYLKGIIHKRIICICMVLLANVIAMCMVMAINSYLMLLNL